MFLDASTLFLVIIGWLFLMTCGSYAYTFKVSQNIYRLLSDLRDNHLKHIQEDLDRIKDRME